MISRAPARAGKSRVTRRTVRRVGLGLTAGLLLLSIAPGLAFAADTIDQQNTTMNNALKTNTAMAQTFTVGLAGGLDAVDVWTFLDSGSGTTTVSIQALDGSGHPDGTNLATATTPIGTTDNWLHVAFTSIYVTVGQKYAIVIQPSVSAEYRDDTSDVYAGGSALDFNGTAWELLQGSEQDLAFRTYVDPAAPAPTPTPTATPAPTPTAATRSAGPSATPPPTATASQPPSGGSGPGLWLFVLGSIVTGCGALLAVSQRRSEPR
jgi:hypothetical protein